MIGPGRLILVVGPSGAGKDSLIAGAKALLADDPRIVFPRRIITRKHNDAEDHETLNPAAFDAAVARGTFSLWWEAHGLKYGIHRSIDDEIAAGCTVVCNVSRTIIEEARARYASVVVVAVTAPPDILAARLLNRGRGSDGQIEKRLSRDIELSDISPDAVIENTGSLENSIQAFSEKIAFS